MPYGRLAFAASRHKPGVKHNQSTNQSIPRRGSLFITEDVLSDFRLEQSHDPLLLSQARPRRCITLFAVTTEIKQGPEKYRSKPIARTNKIDEAQVRGQRSPQLRRVSRQLSAVDLVWEYCGSGLGRWEMFLYSKALLARRRDIASASSLLTPFLYTFTTHKPLV